MRVGLFLGALSLLFVGCDEGSTVDADADGFTDDVDCNDGNAAVNPDALEYCDNIDNNCDGTVDEPGAVNAKVYYADTDGDNYGDPATEIKACSETDGVSKDNTDCDDTNAGSYPGGVEICDGLDNNCDGNTDEFTASDAVTWYFDKDGDGFGTSSPTQVACAQPDGYVDNTDDCNDGNADVFPGATETCNGLDDDCNNEIDDEPDGAPLWYEDKDNDGYGGLGEDPIAVCQRPSGYSGTNDDCDDTTATVRPDAAELCDGVDNDCDTLVDDTDPDIADAGSYAPDADIDGYGSSNPDDIVIACLQPSNFVLDTSDCDDTNAAINPDGTDYIYNDGVDGNCDDEDGEQIDMDDAVISVVGDLLTGDDTLLCDVDGDDLMDLVVSSPFYRATAYQGRVGIWYGAEESWGPDMEIDDADTVIATTQQFMGFGVACGDFNGDSVDDLAIGRGEIQYLTTYDETYEILVYNGSTDGWSGSLNDDDADIRLESELGVQEDGLSVLSMVFTAGDVDMDGDDELLVNHPTEYNPGTIYALTVSDGNLWVVDPAEASGSVQMSDYVTHRITPDVTDGISSFSVIDDYDGDSNSDLLIGQSIWEDASGTITGAAHLLPGPATGNVDDLGYCSYVGPEEAGLGIQSIVGDFDGDGDDDLMVSAPGAEDADATVGVGKLYMFSDVSSLTDSGASADSSADASFIGENENGLLGGLMETMNDIDGDGYDEIVVLEVGDSALHVLSGAALTGEDVTVSDALIISFDLGSTYVNFRDLNVGDIDGDGMDDILLGAVDSSQNGIAYVYTTGDLGL
ncbi:MAG: putative metal-binding motif-containing protein [Myxococcota bacterium]